MPQPLVSVVIPAFNRVPYIQAAIESVIGQDYPALQLIVVDDGSNDGTYELLLDLSESLQFELLIHPDRANRGQSASINLGLKAAKGNYIAILDSDDLFAAGKLNRQVKFLESHPEYGVVYGNGEAIDAEGRPLFQTLTGDHIEPSDPNRLLLDCYIALPGAALVRASAYEAAGYFEEDFRAAQDHDMAIRLMECARFAYLPEIAFYYRKHDGSISVNGLRRRWETGFEILRRAEERYPYKRDTLRKRRAVLNFRMGQTVLREGKRAQALPYLVRSAMLDPVRAFSVLLGRERV